MSVKARTFSVFVIYQSINIPQRKNVLVGLVAMLFLFTTLVFVIYANTSRFPTVANNGLAILCLPLNPFGIWLAYS